MTYNWNDFDTDVILETMKNRIFIIKEDSERINEAKSEVKEMNNVLKSRNIYLQEAEEFLTDKLFNDF